MMMMMMMVVKNLSTPSWHQAVEEPITTHTLSTTLQPSTPTSYTFAALNNREKSWSLQAFFRGFKQYGHVRIF